MCGEKCRRPCLYTRSKSERFSRRPEREKPRGKPAPAFVAGCSTLRFGASALTSSQSCTIVNDNDNDGLCCPLTQNYSRKPGFTETRLRPLARRRDSTAAPLLVFMRVPNPCFFHRFPPLG